MDATTAAEQGTEDRRWLKIEEAAHLLGLSRSKVYELLQDGELRAVKIGGARRIPAHWLAEYQAEHEAAAS